MKMLWRGLAQAHARRRLLPSLAVLCCIAWGGGVSPQALATPPVDSWFRVELLAFAHENPKAGAEESWPQSPALYYPASLVRLSPVEMARTYRVLPLVARRIDRRPAAQRASRLDRAWVLPDPAALGMVRWDDSEALLAETPFLDSWRPFVLLDAPYRLERLRSSVNQRSDYRLLFHEAWHQPIEENEAATHILVQGGGQYGIHHELEGSIAVYRKRFVHVDTNLWLSRPLEDPPAEAATEAPAEAATEAATEAAAEAAAEASVEAAAEPSATVPPPPAVRLPPQPRTHFLSISALQEDIAVPLPVDGAAPEEQAQPEQQAPWLQVAQPGREARSEEQQRGFLKFVGELPNAGAAALAPSVDQGAEVLRHVVVLRQSGRVQNRRSYYFDHPMLGVVVHIQRLH